jgi:hypothetical protein
MMHQVINAYRFGSGGSSGTAPTFVGSKTFSFASTSAQSVSLADLKDSSGATATLEENDFVIIAYNAASGGTNIVFTPPSGWTQECDLFGNDTSKTNFAVWTKFWHSGDTSVTVPGNAADFSAVTVTIHAFRGVNTSSPYDVASVPITGTNDGHVNAGAITPAHGGALIYVAGAVSPGGSGGTVLSNPGDLHSGTNEFVALYQGSISQSSTTGAGFKVWTLGDGAFDPATWGGGRTNTACSWAALTMALRPADV